MSKISKILGAAAFAATLCTGSMTASAGPFFTAIQTQTFSFTQFSGSTTLNFDGFNASLGALESVHMALSAVVSLTNSAANLTGVPVASVGIPTLLSATGTLTVTGPAGLSGSASMSTPGYSGPLAVGLQNVGTNSGTISGSNVLNSPPTNITSYIGGVNAVALTLGASQSLFGSVGSGILLGNDGTANVTVTLQYDYSVADAPEPATMLVLGSGILGLSVIRRRRKV